MVEQRDDRFGVQSEPLDRLLVEDAESALDGDETGGVVERCRRVVAGEEANLPVAEEQRAQEHELADGGRQGRFGDAGGGRVGVGEGGAHVGHRADRRLQRACNPVSGRLVV